MSNHFNSRGEHKFSVMRWIAWAMATRARVLSMLETVEKVAAESVQKVCEDEDTEARLRGHRPPGCICPDDQLSQSGCDCGQPAKIPPLSP